MVNYLPATGTSTRFGHRRRHVYRAGIGVPVLEMTASARAFGPRAFQRCVARAYMAIAYVVAAYPVMPKSERLAYQGTCLCARTRVGHVPGRIRVRVATSTVLRMSLHAITNMQ